MNPAYLNGEYGTTDTLKVNVLDRGFLFGDGVYEAYRLYAGRPFTRELHIARLERSLAGIELRLPCSRTEFDGILDRIEAMTKHEAYVYMQVTRGVAPRRHALPETFEPTLMVMAVQVGPFAAEIFRNGVGLKSQPDERWLRCTVKSLNLLANCLAVTNANRAGAFEALLIGADGLVNESASSTFFAVVNGVIRTAPLTRNILPGVTRHVVIDLIKEIGMPFDETAVTLDEALAADEAFITNSVVEVLPVTRIDETVLGPEPGNITRRVMEAFGAKVREETGAEAACLAGLKGL